MRAATAVVLVAAGDGVRLGAGLPKALVPLAGRPLLRWALESVSGAEVGAVVVAAPPAHLDAVRAMAAEVLGDRLVAVVPGGATRQASVAAALAEVPGEAEVVLVHDAARPLTPSSAFDAVRAAVRLTGGGVVPALRPADTVKRVDATGTVVETIDRAVLAAVQTPQGFPAAMLRAAYDRAGQDAADPFTDDAALVQAAGGAVTVVPGDETAFKVTTPWDLARAEDLLRARSVAAPTRTGLGVDAHAVDASRPLRLGGLDWPGEAGLAGHSDGDAACHAVADALLSAGGLGDLGSVFGTDRPEEAGRAGVAFVERATALLGAAGWTPVSVALQIIGSRPRIAGRRTEMEAVLSAAVGAPVAVSGTTTDGLGFTGRGEGLTAIAVATVVGGA